MPFNLAPSDYYSHHQLKTKPSPETRGERTWALQGQLISEHVRLSSPRPQAPSTRCCRRGKQALLILRAAGSHWRTDRDRTGGE